MTEKIIAQGAEAKIILDNNIIKKLRVKKSYRLSSLDEKIRRQRTKKESRLLEKASTLVPCPKVFKLSNYEISIEFINGKKLSEYLDNLENKKEICNQIGKNLAKLHDNSIIHGDLTTSNMILKGNILYFIDFGLGFNSNKTEDKAVDLHLLKEALEAKHFNIAEKSFKEVLKSYKISKNYSQILERLKKVEQRGRYKQQY